LRPTFCPMSGLGQILCGGFTSESSRAGRALLWPLRATSGIVHCNIIGVAQTYRPPRGGLSDLFRPFICLQKRTLSPLSRNIRLGSCVDGADADAGLVGCGPPGALLAEK
jgi:hypothetical protein